MNIDELLSYSFQEISGNGKLIGSLLHLANKYFNLPATECETSRHYYYERLKTVKNKPMTKKKNYLDKKYILRGDTLLYYNSTHFNNDTLTDKIAAAAIKKFPLVVGLFITDKERKVLEAMDNGNKGVEEAQADLRNDPILEQIVELVKAEQYKEAREKAELLVGDEVKEDSLKSIDKAEEKAVEDAIKAEEAEKKAAEDEIKKSVDKFIDSGKFDEARTEAKKLNEKETAKAVKAIDQSENELKINQFIDNDNIKEAKKLVKKLLSADRKEGFLKAIEVREGQIKEAADKKSEESGEK